MPTHPSAARYAVALLALLAATLASFGLHFAELPAPWGLVGAMAIAAAKVSIVALVFMELAGSVATIRIVALTGVAFLALLCLGIVGDVAMR